MAPRKKKPPPPPVFTDDKPRALWERQKGEPDKAWQAFEMYRDMGPGDRSQRAVSEKLREHRTGTAGRSGGIGQWSQKYAWVERCNAYDAHLDAERVEVFRQEAKDDARRALEIYRAMRSVAGRGLVALDPANMKAADVTRMAEAAITGIRREQGLSTEITGTEKGDEFAAWLTGTSTMKDDEEEDA